MNKIISELQYAKVSGDIKQDPNLANLKRKSKILDNDLLAITFSY